MEGDYMYAIDRIENNIVIAENLRTKEKLELKIDKFPFEPKEGIIFSIENSSIIKQEAEEQERRKLLREKLERLKNHE